MKHPLLTSLLLSALILLAACGGGGSGQPSASGKAETKTGAKMKRQTCGDTTATKILRKDIVS